MIILLKTDYNLIFKNKTKHALKKHYSVSHPVKPRMNSKVSLKSASFWDDCSKISLNYSIRFPANDQTSFRFAIHIGQWTKIAI